MTTRATGLAGQTLAHAFRMVGPAMAGIGLCAMWVGLDLHRRLPGHHSPLMLQSGLANAALSVLAVGFLVTMGPCLVQMSTVVAALGTGLTPSLVSGVDSAELRRRALGALSGFAAGYMSIFALFAVLLLAARGLADWLAIILDQLAGPALAAAGLALAGVLPLMRSCGGPGPFLWRRSHQPPLLLGLGYAIYCVACCGPYLIVGAVLTGSPATRVIGLAMILISGAIPLLAPILLTGLYRRASNSVLAGVRKAAGWFLIGVGSYLTAYSMLP